MAIFNIENDQWDLSNIIWDREAVLKPIDVGFPIETISNIIPRLTVSAGAMMETISSIPFIN